jgi:Domain of unknown function (DUF4136)
MLVGSCENCQFLPSLSSVTCPLVQAWTASRRTNMKPNLRGILIYSWIVAFPVLGFSQKVRVGYDKGTDFLKFRSYTWAAPTMPTTRPLLYESVMGWVDNGLKAKGLTRTEKDGDLVLIPAGGVEFGLNMAVATPILPTYDPTTWIGFAGPSNLMAPYVPEGTLMLTLVDHASNKVVWTGTVSEKLDIENKMKSLERVDKAIAKLLKQFPPKKK